MGTNIYIQSDFIEPYDKYLHDPMGEIKWKRLSRKGRNRREILKLLDDYVAYLNLSQFNPIPLNVIPHGTVEELYNKYEERDIPGENGIEWNLNWDKTGICYPFSELVIYKDEMAHRGEGKEVVDVEDAIIECPKSYASVFLRNKQIYPISYRDLFIGDRAYKLTYISITDKWRSNCGYVVITCKGSDIFDLNSFISKSGIKIDSPIFAFDYIKIPVATSCCPEGSLQKFYVDFNEAPGIPEEVVIKDYTDPRNGDCVPFSEITSYITISKLIEKKLKSD